jgi:hypothetical protein
MVSLMLLGRGKASPRFDVSLLLRGVRKTVSFLCRQWYWSPTRFYISLLEFFSTSD